jgi:hypothetical protein
MKELTEKKSKMLKSIGRINALESVQETERKFTKEKVEQQN